MIKVLLWLALLGGVVWNGFIIFTAHYNNWQAEDVFALLVEKRHSASESEARRHMKKLFELKYISRDDFPEEFFDNLSITATGSGLEVSSWYEVTIWPLGSVQQRDEDGSYHPDDLQGLDIIRDKLRVELEFEPYAISDPSLVNSANR